MSRTDSLSTSTSASASASGSGSGPGSRYYHYNHSDHRPCTTTSFSSSTSASSLDAMTRMKDRATRDEEDRGVGPSSSAAPRITRGHPTAGRRNSAERGKGQGVEEGEEEEEAPRVFWNPPPSTFVREWNNSSASASASSSSSHSKADGAEAVQSSFIVPATRSAGRTAASSVSPVKRSRIWDAEEIEKGNANGTGRRRSRADSSTSTGTTASTSTVGTASSTAAGTSRPARRIKSLRTSTRLMERESARDTDRAGWRRYASSSAALPSNGTPSSSSSLHGGREVNGTPTGGLGGLTRGIGMQRLLADLTLKVQELDRDGSGDDEEGEGHVEADETLTGATGTSKDSPARDRVAEGSRAHKETSTSTSTSPSASQIKTSHLTPLKPSASSPRQASSVRLPSSSPSAWSRTKTFPPTGSPAVARNQQSTFNDQKTVGDDGEVEDEEEDSFEMELAGLDDSILATLPILSGEVKGNESHSEKPEDSPIQDVLTRPINGEATSLPRDASGPIRSTTASRLYSPTTTVKRLGSSKPSWHNNTSTTAPTRTRCSNATSPRTGLPRTRGNFKPPSLVVAAATNGTPTATEVLAQPTHSKVISPKKDDSVGEAEGEDSFTADLGMEEWEGEAEGELDRILREQGY